MSPAFVRGFAEQCKQNGLNANQADYLFAKAASEIQKQAGAPGAGAGRKCRRGALDGSLVGGARPTIAVRRTGRNRCAVRALRRERRDAL